MRTIFSPVCVLSAPELGGAVVHFQSVAAVGHYLPQQSLVSVYERQHFCTDELPGLRFMIGSKLSTILFGRVLSPFSRNIHDFFYEVKTIKAICDHPVKLNKLKAGLLVAGFNLKDLFTDDMIIIFEHMIVKFGIPNGSFAHVPSMQCFIWNGKNIEFRAGDGPSVPHSGPPR